MNRMILLLVLISLPFAAIGTEPFPAPFGLTWGMSEASLIKMGFTEKDISKGQLKTLVAFSVPKAWSEAEAYLAVTYQGNLVKVVAVSKDFTNDITGLEGKKGFSHIKEVLTGKYGKPTGGAERIGGSLYKEYDEFYQCLNYTGCGIFYAVYKFDGGDIFLELKGKSRGVGYLSVSYESPEFTVAKSEIKQSDSTKDADAL